MAHASAPHAHRVRVREVSTGQIIARWPVDARAIIAAGGGAWEYVSDDPAATAAKADTLAPAATPPAVPVEPRSIAAQLEDKSYADLKALAKQAGLTGNIPKAELIAALLPHIEGKTVSLDDVKGLPQTLPAHQFPHVES